MIEVSNHGALIITSNYWRSEIAKAGKIFCSPNAGTIRILIPPAARDMIEAARASKYAILSRGPWPQAELDEAVEIMWEDGTDSPYALHLSPESFALLPAEPEQDGEWLVAIWDQKKGVPHKAVERRCHWRRVAKLPCLKPWAE